MSEPLPPSIGASGLTGRPQIVRNPELVEPIGYDEETGEPVYATPPAAGVSIPPNCLRVVSSPLPVDRGGGCNLDCPGRQRDGGCLAEIVKAANAQGVEWKFDPVFDGRTVWWDYVGPPLAEVTEP